MPDYGVATPLVNSIKRPFQKAQEVIEALPNPPQWFSRMVTPKPASQQGTSYMDQMVQNANQSFRNQPQAPNLSTMKKPLGK